MKLPFSQLNSHLGRELARHYLIAADEPLLVAEATDAVRRAAVERGFDERRVHFVEAGFRWDDLKTDADNLSLFARRRIVEIRMARPRPGDAGAKALRALVADEDPDRLVIVSIQARLDRSALASVWVKSMLRHGVLVEIRPVTRQDMPRFVARRATAHGLSIRPAAAALLADRVEGNLLAADQELAKLALIRESAAVAEAAVLESVAMSARFDVFRLGEAVIDGDLRRAMTVLRGLREEGVAPPLVLWALTREISLLSQLKHATAKGERLAEAMARIGVWQSRRAGLGRALARYSNDDLAGLLDRAVSADRAVKSAEGPPAWEALTALVLALLSDWKVPLIA